MVLEHINDKYYQDGTEINEATFNTLLGQLNGGITITNDEDPIQEDISVLEDELGHVLYDK